MHRQITGKLVIATHNPGKLAEMRELLAPHGVEAVSAGDVGEARQAMSDHLDTIAGYLAERAEG